MNKAAKTILVLIILFAFTMGLVCLYQASTAHPSPALSNSTETPLPQEGLTPDNPFYRDGRSGR